MSESLPRFSTIAGRISTVLVVAAFAWVIYQIRQAENLRDGLQGDVQQDDSGQVTGVNFVGNCPDAIDLEYLTNVPSLRHLRIENTEIPDDVIDAVSQLRTLTLLSLAGSSVTDDQLARVTEPLSLHKLNLSRTTNLAEGITAIECDSLEILEAADCLWITDDELLQLERLPGLVSVNVSNANVTDRGAAVVRRLPELINVDFSGCSELTDITLQRLTLIPSVRTVSIPGLQLKLATAAEFCVQEDRLLRAPLREFPELQPLLQSSVPRQQDLLSSTDEAVRDDAHIFSNGLPAIAIHDDTGLDYSPLKWFSNIQSVRLTGSAVSDNTLQSLAHARDIERLSLAGTGITDACLPQLSAWIRLRRLDLSNTDITAAGMLQLSGLTRLEELTFEGIPITDDVLTLLSGLPDLRGRLNLKGADVSAERLNSLPGLAVQFLSLEGLNLTDDDLAFLARCPNLWTLNLSGTQVRGPGLLHLADVGIRALRLDDTPVDDDALQFLQGHPTLQTLTLAGTNVSGEVPQSFNPDSIHQISLARTKLTDAGLRNIFSWNIHSLSLDDADFSREVAAELPRPAKIHALTLGTERNELSGFSDEIRRRIDWLAVRRAGDQHLTDVGQWQALQHLALANSDFETPDWSPLATLPLLRSLSFEQTRFTPQALDSLNALSGLESVSFYGMQVSDDDKRRVERALPGTKVQVFPESYLLSWDRP